MFCTFAPLSPSTSFSFHLLLSRRLFAPVCLSLPKPEFPVRSVLCFTRSADASSCVYAGRDCLGADRKLRRPAAFVVIPPFVFTGHRRWWLLRCGSRALHCSVPGQCHRNARTWPSGRPNKQARGEELGPSKFPLPFPHVCRHCLTPLRPALPPFGSSYFLFSSLTFYFADGRLTTFPEGTVARCCKGQ